MKFTFIAEHPEYNDFGEEISGVKKTTTVVFEGTWWPSVLSNFMLFLKGSGFYVEEDSVLINDTKHPWIDSCMLDHVGLLSEQGE